MSTLKRWLVRRTVDQWVLVYSPDEPSAINVASQVPDNEWNTSDTTFEAEEEAT